jgi:hypothetical protein
LRVTKKHDDNDETPGFLANEPPLASERDPFEATVFEDARAQAFWRFDFHGHTDIVDFLHAKDLRAPSKDGLPLIKLANFGDVPSARGCYRYDNNVVSVCGVECDYDAGEIPIAKADKIFSKAKIAVILYPSPSSGMPGKGHRWRLLSLFADTYAGDAAYLRSIRANAIDHLERALGAEFAPESYALSTSFYAGRNDGNPKQRYHVRESTGAPIQPAILTKPSSRVPKTTSTQCLNDSPFSEPEPWTRRTHDEKEFVLLSARRPDGTPIFDAGDRPEWLRVAASIKDASHGHENGFALLVRWSATDPKFNEPDNRGRVGEAACRALWDSLRRRGVTKNWFFWEANRRGYRRMPR